MGMNDTQPRLSDVSGEKGLGFLLRDDAEPWYRRTLMLPPGAVGKVTRAASMQGLSWVTITRTQG